SREALISKKSAESGKLEEPSKGRLSATWCAANEDQAVIKRAVLSWALQIVRHGLRADDGQEGLVVSQEFSCPPEKWVFHVSISDSAMCVAFGVGTADALRVAGSLRTFQPTGGRWNCSECYVRE